MIELVSALTNIALLVAFVFFVREEKKERAKLINALIAKTPEQARDLTLADKVTPLKPQPDLPSEFVPIDQLTDEEFDAHIQQELDV